MARRRNPLPCAAVRTTSFVWACRSRTCDACFGTNTTRIGLWWRQKRRSSVLGYYRELKLHAWDYLHGFCEDAAKVAA